MKTFKDLKINRELFEKLESMNIKTPTDIQEKTIPLILKGRDIIGQSATGSGKTLAFGSNLLEIIIPGKGIQALILTPTRELAVQVTDNLSKFYIRKVRNIIAIYGGVSFDRQARIINSSEVIVATPGRLLDHINQKTIDLSKVKLLVLDEADRMLDMGFIDDVEKIIQNCPKERQTLFFSATMPSTIKILAKKYMNNPEEISTVKHVDPAKLKQVYYDIQKNLKLSLLIHLLKKEKKGLVMVFCNTRRNTDFLEKNLKHNGINAIAIHGGLSQNKRSNTMKLFNSNKCSVLVCTDVASRGLHINNVSHVYNYEAPKDSKEYIHRIGRTARAGNEGIVVNLICEYDHENFSKILQENRELNIESIKKPHIEKVFAVMDNKRQQRKPQNNNFQRKRYNMAY